MTDKQIVIDGKECRYCFRDNYRKCSLRGRNDNCDEIEDCFIKELLGKLALKEQKCKELKKELAKVYKDIKLSPLCYKCDEEECLQKEIDKLKAENEMLRDELRFYKDFYYAHN